MKFSPPCAGKADTHGRQACIQIPKLSDAAKSQTAPVMCLTEGSHHHTIGRACSRDSESRPQGQPGAEGPQYHTDLWQLTVAPGVGEGWELWRGPAPHILLYTCVTLLALSLPSLPLALPLSLSYLYFILFREALCCFTGCISAVKTHLLRTLSTPILRIWQSHFIGQQRNTFFLLRSNTVS